LVPTDLLIFKDLIWSKSVIQSSPKGYAGGGGTKWCYTEQLRTADDLILGLFNDAFELFNVEWLDD